MLTNCAIERGMEISFNWHRIHHLCYPIRSKTTECYFACVLTSIVDLHVDITNTHASITLARVHSSLILHRMLYVYMNWWSIRKPWIDFVFIMSVYVCVYLWKSAIVHYTQRSTCADAYLLCVQTGTHKHTHTKIYSHNINKKKFIQSGHLEPIPKRTYSFVRK